MELLVLCAIGQVRYWSAILLAVSSFENVAYIDKAR
jgi:hypothetical protein